MYRSDKSPKSSGSVKSSPTSFGTVKRSVGGDGGEGRRSGGSTKSTMDPEAWELKKRRSRAYHVEYTKAVSNGKKPEFAKLEAQIAYVAVTP